jgi:hypothetical protein
MLAEVSGDRRRRFVGARWAARKSEPDQKQDRCKGARRGVETDG